MTKTEYDWSIKIAKQVPTGLVTPIVEKINLPIHECNPIVRLRGIILVNTKEHCKDFLHSTNIGQTLWRR